MDKEQAEEYVRCRKDPIYFIKKYGKIRHPTKGLLGFELWDFQEDTLQSFLASLLIFLYFYFKTSSTQIYNNFAYFYPPP